MGEPGELFDQDLTGGLLRPIRIDEDERTRVAEERRRREQSLAARRSGPPPSQRPPAPRPEPRVAPRQGADRQIDLSRRPAAPPRSPPATRAATPGPATARAPRPATAPARTPPTRNAQAGAPQARAPQARTPQAGTPQGRAPQARAAQGPANARAAVPDQASSLGRASAVMAAGTLLSRLTGFARVIAVLAVLGVSGVDDAYNYANAIPNIVYDLLLGGILSASLVPVFVEQLRNPDRVEGDRSISAILTTIVLALAGITALLVVAAPLVIRFYLSLKGNSIAAGDERAVGTSLLHLFAPQVFFLGAIVVSTALLNARRQFATAAFSPVINNVIGIAAIGATDLVAHSTDVGVFRHDHRAIAVLGIGTTLGKYVQLH